MTVPHYYQSDASTCGAACLRMLFAALGVTQEEAILAQACQTMPLGCTLTDLVQGTKTLGLEADRLAIVDEAAAVAALSQRVPFVVMIDAASLDATLSLFSWHFVVALALDAGDVLYHDPADGPNRRAPLDDFLAAWATAGYGGVTVWIP